MQRLSFNTKFGLAAVAWLLTGLAALAFNQPVLLLLPFTLLLVPVVINTAVYQPAKLFWWLIALLPLSTGWQVTPTLALDFPDEPLMIALTAIGILYWLQHPRAISAQTLAHPLFGLLAVHIIWLVVICFYSLEPWLSLKFLLAKLWYVLPFVLLAQMVCSTQANIRRLVRLLLVPMFLVVLQTLARHGLLGFSFEGIKEVTQPFFRNHVTYSAMLVCLLAVGWGAWQLTPGGRFRNRLMVALLMALFALVVAWSRGAWLALAVGMLAAWLIRKKWLGKALAMAGIALAAGIGWLAINNNYLRFAPDFQSTIFHTQLADHLQATVALKDVSNAERFYRWVAGANMVAARPLTGFGTNTFYPYYKSYTSTPFTTWVSNNPDHSSVHNYFLLTALEQGLPGLLIFAALYVGMLLYSQRLYHVHHCPFNKTMALVIGIVLSMIGVLNLLSDLVETDKIGSLFWLCLALILVLERQPTGVHPPASM